LREDAPVGSPVTVISHPEYHFYTLTAGIIARYDQHSHGRETRFRMDITADFAKGSSGAPILDEHGNAVGMVVSTQPVFHQDDKTETVQMVFKHCAPAALIRRLVTPARR
jgi:hypothetical protein